MYQLCQAGHCVTDETPAANCNNYDCGTCHIPLSTSYVCANGHCLEMGPNADCQVDYECGQFWYCGIGEKGSGNLKQCALNYRTTGCPYCRDGYTCESRTMLCGSQNSHDVCVYVPLGSMCGSTYQCGANRLCRNGVCEVADGSCPNGITDCPNHYGCEAGQCVNWSTRNCNTSSQCGMGDCCQASPHVPPYAGFCVDWNLVVSCL